MKTLYFNDIETLCCDIADKYDSQTDEFADISIIAKYDEANQIIKELLCMGYDVASIDLHREEFEEYWDEYVISLNFDGVWCEKFKRDNGYFNEDSNITYISNECNSASIPYVKSKKVYAFEVGESSDSEKESEDSHVTEYDTKDGYHVTVKCDLDADEALKIIEDMEKRIIRMNDAFAEMDRFRQLFRW